MKLYPLIITLLFGACTGYKVTNHSFDKNIDFRNYKYFAWLPDKDTSNTQYDNRDFRKEFIKDFTRALCKKEHLLHKDSAQILIELTIHNFNQRKQTTYVYNRDYNHKDTDINNSHISLNNPLPPEYYYISKEPSGPNMLGGYNYTNTSVTQQISYVENYITVNIIDRKQKKLIWTATSEASLYETDVEPSNPHSIIRKLLKFYPIK